MKFIPEWMKTIFFGFFFWRSAESIVIRHHRHHHFDCGMINASCAQPAKEAQAEHVLSVEDSGGTRPTVWAWSTSGSMAEWLNGCSFCSLFAGTGTKPFGGLHKF